MTQRHGLIGYFVHHPVAANLLMLFIVCMGLLSYQGIQRQTFPISDNNRIIVTATQLGASAREIEENILLKIEQALKPQVGIKRLTSQATPSRGLVDIELEHDQDLPYRLDEIKMKLDAIATFPATMEPLRITERAQRQRALSVVLSGPDNPLALKKLGNELKDELLQLDGISHVDLSAIPDYEVAIELSPIRLQEYKLSLSDVVNAIQTHADNLSAGRIKTARGNIYLRLEQRGYQGSALANTPVITGPLGETVLLRDIATIKDGFRETLDAGRFNGEQAVYIMVLAAKEQSLTAVVAQVKAYIEYKRRALPEHIHIHEFVDVTHYLQGRLNMMLENLAQGAILVFIVLAVFLRTRLAVWVMVGLPVSMLGAFWLMPLFGITMNLVSLFAFIMVLGIVVDDAIVIGESVCEQVESNGHTPAQVIRGAQKVAMPATFGVLTTIAVFMPFMFSSGPNSGQFIAIAGVCILCLFFSLIESKLILPVHLAATRLPPKPKDHWRNRFNARLQYLLHSYYAPLLNRCIHYRYAVIAGFICLLVLALCLVISGLLRFTPVPKVPHDYPSINIQMHHTVSEAQTLNAVEQIENLINRVEHAIQTETGKPMMDVMYTRIDHLTEAEVVVPLVPEAQRPFDTFELARRWREQLPDIPGVKKLTIESDVIDIAEKSDLEYRLFAKDAETLSRASRDFINQLNTIRGVHSVYSTLDNAQTEYQIQLKPLAHQLKLSAKEVTRQVGARFYGLEIQRIMREGQEVVFKVRGTLSDRQQLSALPHTLITLPNGEQVFFGDVAQTVAVPGFSSIHREQGHQVATISANVDAQYTAVSHVADHIDSQLLPELTSTYQGLTTQPGVALEAQKQEQSQVMKFGIIGLLVVYCLLALPMKSYLQPLIVMSVIPFSVVGALWGHYLLGYSLSMMSVFGIVAAAGVVINDSLVMTDVINRQRTAGQDMKAAVVEAGIARFRAILLTSLTTFLGLVPIMFESSLQAQFVIPTAISLSFSVVFATAVTLLMVPCLYVMLEDLKQIFTSYKPAAKAHQL
ncbi:acriflavin resistance protein [Pseudoalteromonas rubra]|uniref:Acriflavin resistance protein n=1 Tax=Pseudoalteromonas rubra TaxID=43658 RepID=A0A5S3WNJ8_9GAMM|nr:efflux RND transporter permease subunit [Pseudoalteromonas rubra]TMP28537.1 acriflavin resistance protein [Pseudoalteromonas rubra]TMP30504.1 acriflavin resistance protein [Pseudoalteromonas rubra]